jgi:hypothetical protein
VTEARSAPDPVSADGAQAPGLGQPFASGSFLAKAGPFPSVTDQYQASNREDQFHRV